MKEIKTNLYLDECTIHDIEILIKRAYDEGWESDDSFLLAVDFKVNESRRKIKCQTCNKDLECDIMTEELICTNEECDESITGIKCNCEAENE